MADVHNKETRSFNMSRIRSKNTSPELLVRKYFFGKGLRYRIHCKELPGTPDILFPKYKTAVFVNGCFWHSHFNCKRAVIPKSNTGYWSAKINRNIKRDELNYLKLVQAGWKIIVIWECELKKIHFDQTMADVLAKVKDHL